MSYQERIKHKKMHQSAVKDPAAGTNTRTALCGVRVLAEDAVLQWRSVTCQECLICRIVKDKKLNRERKDEKN